MRFTTQLLLPLLVLSGCSTCSRSSEESIRQQMENTIDSITAAMEGQRIRDSIDMARAQELDWQIDSLKDNYNVNAAATNYNMLVHKAWDVKLDLDRNGLMAVVFEETGSIVLISTLPDLPGVHHNRIEIEIAGKIYSADSNYTYPLTEPDRYQHTGVTYAKGEVLYILEAQALDIIQAIAANPNEEITVRAYFSNEVYASYTLSDGDKKAIIAAFKLCKMMLEQQALEGQYSEWDD